MQTYTFSQGNHRYTTVQKADVDNNTGKFGPRRTLYGKVKDWAKRRPRCTIPAEPSRRALSQRVGFCFGNPRSLA